MDSYGLFAACKLFILLEVIPPLIPPSGFITIPTLLTYTQLFFFPTIKGRLVHPHEARHYENIWGLYLLFGNTDLMTYEISAGMLIAPNVLIFLCNNTLSRLATFSALCLCIYTYI